MTIVWLVRGKCNKKYMKRMKGGQRADHTERVEAVLYVWIEVKRMARNRKKWRNLIRLEII